MDIISTKMIEMVEIEMAIFDEMVNETKIWGETDPGVGFPLKGKGLSCYKKIVPEHDAGSDGGKTEKRSRR